MNINNRQIKLRKILEKASNLSLETMQIHSQTMKPIKLFQSPVLFGASIYSTDIFDASSAIDKLKDHWKKNGIDAKIQCSYETGNFGPNEVAQIHVVFSQP